MYYIGDCVLSRRIDHPMGQQLARCPFAVSGSLTHLHSHQPSSSSFSGVCAYSQAFGSEQVAYSLLGEAGEGLHLGCIAEVVVPSSHDGSIVVIQLQDPFAQVDAQVPAAHGWAGHHPGHTMHAEPCGSMGISCCLFY